MQNKKKEEEKVKGDEEDVRLIRKKRRNKVETALRVDRKQTKVLEKLAGYRCNGASALRKK